MRSLRRLAIATVAVGAVLWGTSGGARAGILITVTEVGGTGGTSFSNTAGNTGIFSGTVGDYQVNVDVGSTNFPGTTFGILTTTTNTQLVASPSGGGSPGSLVVTTSVVNDNTTTLATFTSPGGTALNLNSEIRSTGVSSGTIDFTSTSNGTTSPTETVTIPSPAPNINNIPVTGGPGYTLSNTTTLHLNAGDASIGSTGTSTVTAVVPEPTTMAMALTALPILGVVRRLRRKGAMA